MPIDSSELLSRLGYDYYSFVDPPVEPVRTGVRFSDVLPGLAGAAGRAGELASEGLYSHQLEALDALRSGKNLVLVSGSGSGKTEAWFCHSASARARTLVVYPTLALSEDQVRRLSDYSSALGLRTAAIDSLRREELAAEIGRRALPGFLSSADVLITNPAFLMNDLKRAASGSRGSLLAGFISGMDLLVLDELDFYGPREASLLLSMARLMAELTGRDFQVAVLTATLGNPRELADILTGANGRETAVVRGRPFRVENRTYVVLGKNLRAIWEAFRERREAFEGAPVGRDVLEALDDFDRFREEAYKVVEAARYLGLDAPGPEVDAAEILRAYAGDDGVTIAFTRSIRAAEEVRRRIGGLEEGVGPVETHHHLVPKERRREIERAAREGEVRVLISPRTLAQGIDIGSVVRVVHLGLPESVREFRQREGRKGRRRGIPFTETVVIPRGRWDRELLLRGPRALEAWARLPLERTVILRSNRYPRLFEALFRFVSRDLRGRLSRADLEFLGELGLVSASGLTQLGKRVWNYMNFYEFGPPFGMKRVLRTPEGERYLADIGHCDLVERFQPGCLDYSSNGLVVDLLRRGRVVTGCVVEPLSYRSLRGTDFLAHALEEYRKVKYGWGEDPDPVGDFHRGRLHSEVVAAVDPPARGFGLLRKVPNRVYWRLRASAARPVRAGGRTHFVRPVRSIPVLGPTGGVYRDYTYGLAVELDPREDLEWMRVGMAAALVALRITRGLPTDLLSYSLASVGGRKVLLVHEDSCSGILEGVDWAEAAAEVESFRPDDLAEVLLLQVDEEAHLTLASSGMRWDLALRWAGRALRYLAAAQREPVSLGGVELLVPRPSRALGVASLEALAVPLDDESRVVVGGVAVFDGEACRVVRVTKEFFQVSGWQEASIALGEPVNSGFSVVVYDLGQVRADLDSLGLSALSSTLAGLAAEGRVVEVRREAEGLVPGILPRGELERALGGEPEVTIRDVLREALESRRLVGERGLGEWRRCTRYLLRSVEGFLEGEARALYRAHLALSEARRRGGGEKSF